MVRSKTVIHRDPDILGGTTVVFLELQGIWFATSR